MTRFNIVNASMGVLLSMIYFSAAATTMTISGTPPTTATVGQQYQFVPMVENANVQELQFSYANKPSWSNAYRGSGAIIGTPTEPGVYANIQIEAWDGVHYAVSAPFTINVVAPTGGEGAANLSWSKPALNTNGSPLKDLAGYIVRYGTNTAALNTQISLGSADSTSVQIENLTAGKWYFEVAAVNTVNIQSEFSAIVGNTIQ